MQPYTGPAIQPPTHTTCTDCDGDLRGNRLRCPACVRAAAIAVEKARGQVVRPSDVARVRERLADA